jgi:putative ABC transport system substrate-binding protein
MPSSIPTMPPTKAKPPSADWVKKRRLPTITDFTWPGIEPQPLMRYSPPAESLLRQAAEYIDRILRAAAKPAELPIQRHARFEFEINMRTAKALGLELPPSLVLRADKIVE